MNQRRLEHIEHWAEYIKTHKGWKRLHTRFINAQFKKHDEFIKRLLKMPNGREKIIKLYGIKNIKGYARLLGTGQSEKS